MNKLMRKTFLKCFVLSISTILSILCVEIFLNYFDNYKSDGYVVKDGQKIDVRDTWRFIFDYTVDGKSAYPAAFPTWVLSKRHLWNYKANILPLGGISNVWSNQGQESEGLVIYQSDRYGFYNNDELWDKSPKVLLIGDSFAQSAYIHEEATLSSIISEQFQTTLSLGMPASGPLLALASLREYGPVIKPKYTIFIYSELNNLSKLERELEDQFLIQYLIPGFRQNLADRQIEVDDFLKDIISKQPEYISAVSAAKTGSNFSSIIRLRNIRAKFSNIIKSQEVKELTRREVLESQLENNFDLESYKRILIEARNECQTWGGELIVLYNSEWGRYSEKKQGNSQRDSILQLLDQLDIDVIDLHPVWEAKETPLDYFASTEYSSHFNRKGYRVVAETIIEHLVIKNSL